MFVVIGQEVLTYDDPSKIMLGALKAQAETQGKFFKCFCVVNNGKDGVIVSTNNDEPKYFASEQEADRYARNKQCDVYYCQEIQV